MKKTIVITFVRNISLQYALIIHYSGKYIEEMINTKCFGLQIDNHVNLKKYIEQTITKLSGACNKIDFNVYNIDTT